MWFVAALTFASGLITALRMSETLAPRTAGMDAAHQGLVSPSEGSQAYTRPRRVPR
jgi:hypothetical protein